MSEKEEKKGVFSKFGSWADDKLNKAQDAIEEARETIGEKVEDLTSKEPYMYVIEDERGKRTLNFEDLQQYLDETHDIDLSMKEKNGKA